MAGPTAMIENIPKGVKEEGDAANKQIAELKSRREKASKPDAKPASPPEPQADAPTEVQPQPSPLPAVPTPAAPAAVQPAAPIVAEPTQGPAAPVAQTQTFEQIKADNASLKQQLALVNGRHGEQLSKLRTQIETLQQQLSVRPADPIPPVQLPTLRPSTLPEAASVVSGGTNGSGKPAYLRNVPEELIEQYGEEYFKTAAMAADGVIEDRLGSQGDQVRKQVDSSLKAIEAERRDRAFWQDAERLEPGTAAIHGDPDNGIPPMNGLADFLNSPLVAGSPVTKLAEAQAAYDKNDVNAFVRLTREFKASRPDLFAPQSNVPRPTIAAQTVPSSVGSVEPSVDSSAGSGGARRQIPQSEISAFHEAVSSRKITDEVAINSKLAEYRQAMFENRIIPG